jgi:hypothetical protein
MIKAINPETGAIFQVIQIGTINFTGKVISDPRGIWKVDSVCTMLYKKHHHIMIDWNTFRDLKQQVNGLKDLLMV